MASTGPDSPRENLGAVFRKWCRQARLCLGNNDRFVRENRSGFLVLRQRTAEAEAALGVLLPDPDRAFDPSRMFKCGTRTHAGIVNLSGRRYVLKRYNDRGWRYRFTNVFRRSRAVRAWLVNWQYLVRAVPVPEPLLCLEERRFRFLLRSYVLMEAVDNAVTLRVSWAQLAEAEKARVGVFWGELLGRMHRTGMLHGDLKWDNLLVGPDPLSENVRLVDLDGSFVSALGNHGLARKDLNRFLKDLSKEEGSAHLCDEVVRAWERALV